MRIETIAVHAGHAPDAATGAVTPPIHLSTTFEREPDLALPEREHRLGVVGEQPHIDVLLGELHDGVSVAGTPHDRGTSGVTNGRKCRGNPPKIPSNRLGQSI